MTDMQIAEVATVTQIYTCDTHALNKLWELSKYQFPSSDSVLYLCKR
jgi:hypothetical protein